VVQSPVDAAHGADPDQPEAVLQSPAPEVLAEIRRHWNADRKAANVVLVVDTSGTMGRRGRLARVQAGLQDFVDRLRPRDRVGLVTFASQVSTPVPLAPLGDHEADLRQAIREVVPSGRSALYDAVRAGFASVRALDDTTRINAVVVVADGADDSSASTLAGLARELSGACSGEEAALPVITVAYGADADRKALARIAGACQGRALSAAPGDVEETLRAVSLLF
jgi:Ca-activated chloride channel family protein